LETKQLIFFNAKAVRLLNEALLKMYYQIEWWEIPEGFLCPPIPGRAEYIHRVAELVSANFDRPIRCLDIGTGANCIYPIIGIVDYQWQFVGVDCDENALVSSQQIIAANIVLQDRIVLRRQFDASHVFKHVIQSSDYFDLTICNPPFHDSQYAAQEVAMRKIRNLRKKSIDRPVLNFGGKSNELWCEGGERRFVETMIVESTQFKSNVRWFTTLVSKGSNLPFYRKILAKSNVSEVREIEMSFGNKISRILCWTFKAKN
jgi:23S rRNA (adenine1618-N6)-methyltransferase